MSVEKRTPGTLFIVATPMGNLADMTFRAIDTLKSVDLIAAEDTRHSRRLLDHYGIPTRLISCHEHNEINKLPGLISDLNNGKQIALISDAGTPTISDPGYKLVAAAAQNSIPVIPIPGCSAAVAGLSVSGLPTDSFYFLGFLPRKAQKLRQALSQVKQLPATLIIYESPKRITNLTEAAKEVLGDRNACLAREITKLHEEYLRGTLSEMLAELKSRPAIKGECSLFIEGYTGMDEMSDEQLEQIITAHLETDTSGTSKLAGKIAKEHGVSKKKVYEMILQLKEG